MNSKPLVYLSILTPVLFAGFLLSSNPTSAASASTATAAVKIAASCTLTSTGGGNYSATVPNGTSAEIPGSTLSVSCSHPISPFIFHFFYAKIIKTRKGGRVV